MRKQARHHHRARYFIGLMLAALVIVPIANISWPTHAAELQARSLTLSDSQASDTTTYTASFTIESTDAVGSIKISVCTNSPVPEDSCTHANGFDFSQAVLSDKVGLTDVAITSQTADEIVLSRTPAAITAPLDVSFTFDKVVNPSDIGSYFGRLQTFGTSDASGSYIDYGGLAFAITTNVQLTTVVPPYLMFCSGIVILNLDCAQTTGSYINFGELSTTQPRYGQSQMLAATNAQAGYNVTVTGTTLTSGNNIISAIAAPDISRPGTAQFGLNLRANIDPGVGEDPSGPGSGGPLANYATANRYAFIPNDTLAVINQPDLNRQYTVSYIVNVPKGQAAGVYVSTLTYICLANF